MMLKNVLTWCMRIVVYGQNTIKTRFSGWGTALGRLAVVAIVLFAGSGCEVAEEKARAEAARAEADRVSAEAAADRERIEAEAEREAARIAAQADAEAQQAIAKAKLQQAQNEHLHALAESTRASGEREIMESVARQIDANSEHIRAQTSVTYAQAKQTIAESYGIYALIAVAGILALGVAGFFVLAGIAKVRSAGALPAPQQRYQVIERRRRQQSVTDDYDDVSVLARLSYGCLALANKLEQNNR
jgi:hypothetical protein